MRVVDRYLAGRFWAVWAPVAAGFLALFVVVEVFEKLRLILKYSPSPTDMALFFAARTPWMLTQILPMTGLLATAFALTGLARRGELAALRAGGLSLRRLAVPFLAAGLVLTAGHAVLQELVAPRGFALAHEIKDVRIKGKSAAGLVRTTDVWLRVPGGFLHLDRIEPGGDRLQGIEWVRVEGGRIRERLTAASARWTGEAWVLEGGERRRFDTGEGIGAEPFESLAWDLGVRPEDLVIEDLPADALTWRDLRRRIARYRARGFDTLDLEVSLWAKTALPAATALLPFLGFAFCVGGPPRASGHRGFLAALGAAVAFGLAQAVSLALGRTGALPPPVAAWLPVAAFAAAGAWRLGRAERAFS